MDPEIVDRLRKPKHTQVTCYYIEKSSGNRADFPHCFAPSTTVLNKEFYGSLLFHKRHYFLRNRLISFLSFSCP